MKIAIPNLLRIKPNALYKIGKYLRQNKLENVALFWGESIKGILGDKVEISFSSSDVKVEFEKTVDNIDIKEAFDDAMKLNGSIDGIVAIGGGKAIDYCKYIAFINKLPLIVIPTVVSNDGFCSSLSSMLVNGKRKSIKTKIPDGVVVDINVIRNAPIKFLYSGVGDLICKPTAIYDWKLAYKKNGEYVNDFAVSISQSSFDNFKYYPDKSIDNDEYLRIIINSLLMSGISMEISNCSRPASGSEHLISHAYDKVAKDPVGHGLQVGVSTYLISYLQNNQHEEIKKIMVDSGLVDYISGNPLSRTDFIEAIKLAPTIKDNFYTILSENGMISKAIEFVENDELMSKLLA